MPDGARYRALRDEQKYWVLATMAEASLGAGDAAAAAQKLAAADALNPAQWMKDSTAQQLEHSASCSWTHHSST